MNELALVLGYGVLGLATLAVLVALALVLVGGFDAGTGKFAKAADVASLESRIQSLEYRPTYSVASAGYYGTPAYGYNAASTAFAAENAKKKRKRAA